MAQIDEVKITARMPFAHRLRRRTMFLVRGPAGVAGMVGPAVSKVAVGSQGFRAGRALERLGFNSLMGAE